MKDDDFCQNRRKDLEKMKWGEKSKEVELCFN